MTGFYATRLMTPWRVGVGTAGAFTDLVLINGAERVREFKASSKPSDPAGGVVMALGLAARVCKTTIGELLVGFRQFIHGSTIATNTILECKGTRVGLLVTDGFCDALEIRRDNRESSWGHRLLYPPILVSRKFGRPIAERIGCNREVVIPLDEAGIADQVEVAGYHLPLPAVSIHAESEGGGTIAQLDSGGMTCANPDGAGALSGLAAYAPGESDPTVTDAQFVQGRLCSTEYAGGLIELMAGLADKAIEISIGKDTGLTTAGAAIGNVRLIEQCVVRAIEQVSIERGLDPSRFVLIATGAAGPISGAAKAVYGGVINDDGSSDQSATRFLRATYGEKSSRTKHNPVEV
ncbi:hypothetical protein HBA54_17665 [Pelagibius litoralis]|uniref:Hydantoinase A/oxoprolinase domain-containing protein n=1 Tax=Pelagibius litoralis TaxID=374515 RepID=A0A967EZT1_9PROT|nr:hydantoinase/oxoprolinase family protein [Pelagibius litoralis]NIA70430.1 hypothetical protein [Pelagibius litoralis]